MRVSLERIGAGRFRRDCKFIIEIAAGKYRDTCTDCEYGDSALSGFGHVAFAGVQFSAFVGAEGVSGIHGVASEGEDIRVFSETTDAAMAMIQSGEINNSIGVIGVQWLALNRDNLRMRWR